MRRLINIIIVAILTASIGSIANANAIDVAEKPTKVLDLSPTPLNLTETHLELHIDTTNPYSDITTVQNALDEIDDAEGVYPLYVLVFADEEEREYWERGGLDWTEYAISIIEQGDEALVANFGIDIRILATISFDNIWKSDDNLKTMNDIWLDLESETYIFMGCYYKGGYWQDYVDAIIGITKQDTNDGIAGLAPGNELVDQRRAYILIKWQAWWLDDNVVQHEVTHLFYPDDHYGDYCVMNPLYVYEAYTWCTDCTNILNLYKRLYENSPYMLVVRYADLYNHPEEATLSHLGIYTYSTSTWVTISASETGFLYWLVDGTAKIYENPITIQINSKHAIAANFTEPPPPPPPPQPPPPSSRRGGGGSRFLLRM